MKRSIIVACICTFTLAASLLAVDTLPAFAAEAPKEPVVDEMQIMGEDFAEEESVPIEVIEAEDDTGKEKMREGKSAFEPEMNEEAAAEPEIVSFPAAGEEQETASENNDGLIYVDGMLYNGYYRDNAGIMYIVSNGVAEPETGMVEGGTAYYSYPDKEIMTLPKQTVFVAGKVYTGYYMDSAGIMYIVSNGAAEPKAGTVGPGTAYYSYSGNGMTTLPKQAVFVAGKVYTGYYADSKDKMYHVKKGARTLTTGTVKAGTSYYSYNAKETLTLSKETLYVKGKVYTGYYMSRNNKMYRVKKGTRTLKTGIIKAGTKYYSYNAGKKQTLSKETLYVKGKIYTGYYMSHGKKMYRVKKGACTLKTGMLNAGTKYYSYDAGKTRTLSKQVLYVKGKVYTGYYMNHENKMYRAEKGTCTLVNATLNAGTKYYSYHAKKTLELSNQTVFVNGKAMEGMSAESLATLQRAQAVVARITNDSMTKEEKLKACFEFVKTYQGGRPRIPHYMGMDWPVVYANDMFLNDGKGNCFSYAAAFAYMAKAIGYEEVYCCSDSGHGWAEIDGLIYDPERSKFDPTYSYYAISYDTKTNVDHKGGIAAGQPWMHIKI